MVREHKPPPIRRIRTLDSRSRSVIRITTKIVSLGPWAMPYPGFVQTLESPGIKMLGFPGLESPGKRHRSWKSPGIL